MRQFGYALLVAGAVLLFATMRAVVSAGHTRGMRKGSDQ